MRHATLGKESLIYFRSIAIDNFTGKQRIIIPMICDAKTPDGYVRCEANTVKDLESVSREFEAQKRADFAKVDEAHLQRMMVKVKSVRDRLNYRLLRTRNQFEKDFIRLSLKKLEEGEKNLMPRRVEGCLAIESTEAPLN